MAAENGEQEAILNRECFSIGTLAGAGGVPAGFAERVLLWAACQVVNYDPKRPWRRDELERKVRRSFSDGMARPRHPQGGRRG